MAGKERHVRFRGGKQGETGADTKQNSILKSTGSRKSGEYGIPHFVIISAFIGALFYAVFASETFLPSSNPVDSSKDVFSGDRARKHLVDLTNLGARPTGSYANDISAVKIIVDGLNKIKSEANIAFDIELDVQTVSGSLAFVRGGLIEIGYTTTYDNITNIIVKISSKKSTSKSFILVNGHFDTVMNTEGASDDTVSCAVMMETLRTLAHSNPDELKHGVIFLFNGAEEGPLAGSHGFIMEHKWRSLPKVVVNLEAAGSGGREFVFQTGPEHPWILDTYASSAKYPYTSVVAQEVFQAGLIPSDTDFRVFVQYGNLVGLDFAFINNGYIYHTRYDDAKSIPSGSIQRAGDNVYGVIKSMANSPYLEDPSKYKHGSSVFFDVLGIFVIRYPKRLHLLMNNLTCAVVLLYFLQKLVRRSFSSGKEHVGIRQSMDHMTIGSVILSIATILLSWLLAISCAFGVAYLLIKLEFINTWYSYPRFGIFLFGLPSLFGMLLGHYLGNIVIRKLSISSIASLTYAHLLVYCVLLYWLNTMKVMSSFIIWFWVAFPFLLLAVGSDLIPFLPEKKALGIFLLHLLGTIVPMVISLYHGSTLFSFFGALLGRTGTELPGDYVIAGLSAFFVIVCVTYLMGIYQHAVNMRRFLVFVAILSCLPLAYVLSGRMKPYSSSNPITPKRLFMMHMQRTFYAPDGSVTKEDSAIWVQPTDYVDKRPLDKIPFYQNLQAFQCDGAYCGLPYYYPMRKVLKQPYVLPCEKAKELGPPLTWNAYRREVISANKIRYFFDIKGPDHMNLFVNLKPGVKLTDWSMYKTDNGHIYSMDDANGGRTYIVLYAHGYYSDSWKFWLELEKGEEAGSELADVGIARHNWHGTHARTAMLKKAIAALPPWICDNAWTANYDHFTLA